MNYKEIYKKEFGDGVKAVENKYIKFQYMPFNIKVLNKNFKVVG